MFREAADLPVVRHLPDPFTFLDGRRLAHASEWPARRRELSELAQHYAYGLLPPPPASVKATLHGTTLGVTVSDAGRSISFDVKAVLPSGKGPFPAFIFMGRTPPLEPFTRRGYATLWLDTSAIASDAQPSTGAFRTLYPDADAGVLAAWAWGMHRVVDAVQSIEPIAAGRLAVNGFSRWGKAALVAGALDERIALTVPSSSGLSGVGQYRYFYEDAANPEVQSEKIGNIINYAPQWFTPRLRPFEHQVERLPFDQHSLLALVAPRALFVTTGTRDHWCNPRGSALTLRAAAQVFTFLGAEHALGASWDDAGHEYTEKHVGDMLDFADVHLSGARLGRSFDPLPGPFPDEPAAHPWAAP